MRLAIAAPGLFTLLACGTPLVGAPQFINRYVAIGEQAQARLLASDSSGNLFAVATVTEPSGQPQIRATKTDPQGNALSSIDFGSSTGDILGAAAVDRQGNLWVVGSTSGSDFPLVSPLFSKTTAQAAFVVELDSQLRQIVFSTRLGGTQGGGPIPGGTWAYAVAVDDNGNVYVAGDTTATDFPTTPGALQSAGPASNMFGSAPYAYVTEISSTGKELLYSTYFGSSVTFCNGTSGCIGVFGGTSATAIAVDPSGEIVIAGSTTSTQLLVTARTLGGPCGCNSMTPVGFVAKLAAGGAHLAWGTYITLSYQGPPYDVFSISGLGLDASGDIVIGGSAPPGLPTTKGALEVTFPDSYVSAGFIAKIDPSGQHYIFSTYFGGDLYHVNGVAALAVDAQGNVWVTGESSPSDLPFPSSVPVFGDTYVAGLSPDGTTLVAAITAPVGAAGQSIVATAQGTVAALGISGSLLISSAAQGPSLLGIANSAATSVSGEVAPDELVSLYGIGIGPANPIGTQVVNGIVEDSLGGYQVLFGGTPAPLLYAGPDQINAVVPSKVYGQSLATVEIATPTGTITGPSLSVVPSRPEVFQSPCPTSVGTQSCTAALNEDGSVNSPGAPARAGSIVSIWATGAGLSYPLQPEDGSLGTRPESGAIQGPVLPVSVLKGAAGNGPADSLEVLYAGDAPGLVTGVVQVNFRLPSETMPFGYLVFQLEVGGALSDPFTIYVGP